LEIIEFMLIVWHNPTVEITYKLTQRDFFDSMIAHRNRSRLAKWSFRIMLSIALLAGAIGIIALVTQPTSQLSINAIILIALAIFWALCKWAAPWWSARNQFRKQPSAQGPRILMLDSTGTHWRWDGGTADVEWKNVIRYLEGKNEFLLYSSPAAFNMVPETCNVNGTIRGVSFAAGGTRARVEARLTTSTFFRALRVSAVNQCFSLKWKISLDR
jgi:hypothetical protein